MAELQPKSSEVKISPEKLQQLGDEMFDYVEEYRALKYTDFPPEYQELVKARIILKPYWQVKTNVEKMFGKTYAESSYGQRLINKERERMRRANPEMEKYRQMFYVT